MGSPSGNFRQSGGGATAYGSAQQTGVLYLGAALVIVANWVTVGAAFQYALGNKTVKQQGGGLGDLLPQFAGEGVMLLILWLLAGISSEAGTFALLLVIGLWVAWILAHPGIINLLGSGVSSGVEKTTTKEGGPA